jgi:CheY-like chemotaxis protein
MTKILVVDDLAADRQFVGKLLGEDPEFHVEYAADGAEALDRIEASPPELVVTDLIMPQLDGLKLVEQIRLRHPLVPVILITSKGNEEIASQALRRGAASYVPKREMPRDLLGTVRRVLGIAARRRDLNRLMGRLAKSDCEFVLENDAALFAPLVSYFQDELGHLGLCGDADQTRVGVALEEALSNALYHGNLELGSELREEDDTDYHKAVQERMRRPPYCERRIRVRAKLSPEQALFVIRDEGPGFDPSSLPDPTDPENLERACGRGILLMKTFMDRVEFNAAGNAVTLVKQGRQPPGERG